MTALSPPWETSSGACSDRAAAWNSSDERQAQTSIIVLLLPVTLAFCLCFSVCMLACSWFVLSCVSVILSGLTWWNKVTITMSTITVFTVLYKSYYILTVSISLRLEWICAQFSVYSCVCLHPRFWLNYFQPSGVLDLSLCVGGCSFENSGNEITVVHDQFIRIRTICLLCTYAPFCRKVWQLDKNWNKCRFPLDLIISHFVIHIYMVPPWHLNC